MPKNPFEIYVRQSGGRNLLMVHEGEADVDAPRGREAGQPSAYLEMMVLPEWITDDAQREAYEKLGDAVHIRIPISGDLPF